MNLNGTMLVLGAKRREYKEKWYCDLFAAAEQEQTADAVGHGVDTYRMEPKLVDALRHVKLPTRMQFSGSLQMFGEKAVITITDLQPLKA